MLQDPAPSLSPSHSRRPPAHLSVSLRHDSLSPASSACSRRAQAARDDETGKASLAWRLSPIRRLSDESNESAEVHVETWFDRSNKNVGRRLGPQFIDSDPPFFLHDQTYTLPNSTPEGEGRALASHAFASTTSQFAPDVLRTATVGSRADDFRSVIDDLTIENKRLKERLRKYEKSHTSSQLDKDKLFEVKVHGLTASKKRELEETLHTFASRISTQESTSTSSSRHFKDSKTPASNLQYISKNPSSLATSNSRIVDSAYASLSTYGPVSSSTLNHGGAEKRKGAAPSGAFKVENVQSFLDDIPPGLLRKHSTVMTERGKKKLIVRRLEQLFTGKIRASGDLNSQPLQQQEVSDSAARDDRQAIESRGQHVSAEGVREAHILPTETELEKIVVPKLPGEACGDSSSATQVEGGENSTDLPGFPDQRPTRPLDLDPDRTQVPLENIEYIRHLGISTPNMGSEDLVDAAAEEGHGWVYLNLLTNMAQLHIINVTPDFIRSAVTELSTKFQLSPDRSKIRWRGGTEGTELSSDSGAENDLRPSPNDSDSLDEGNNKRRKMDKDLHQVSASEQIAKQGRLSAVPVTDASHNQPIRINELPNRLYYKPLFAHQSSTEDDEMSLDDTASQTSFVRANESGTGQTSDAQRRSHSGSVPKRKRGDGAIIFYSGAKFCTDLSGDREHISTPIHVIEVGVDGFSNRSHDALGCNGGGMALRPLPTRSPSGSTVSFEPVNDYSVCEKSLSTNEERSRTPEPLEYDNLDDFHFSPKWTVDEQQQSFTPLALEACGLGGTRPSDHFAVTVQMRHGKLDGETSVKLSKFSAPSIKTQRFLHKISKSSLSSFRSTGTGGSDKMNVGSTASAASSPLERPLEPEIVSTKFWYLDPSELPPPATYHGALTSSTEWSEDTPSETEAENRACSGRHTRFTYGASSITSVEDPMIIDYADDDDENDGLSDGEDSETSSINFLAHARKLNPQSVEAKEQEYEREAGKW